MPATTTLRGGQVVPVQVARSMAPSWGVSCPYCGARNDLDAGVFAHGKCGACDGEYLEPEGALRVGRWSVLSSSARTRWWLWD